MIPIGALIPNFITLLALCMGLTAIRMSVEERYELAVFSIIIAAVLDSLDGSVARMLKSTSRFGAQLDSLSDFLSFGIAPAILLYNWSLRDLGSIGWISVMCFSIAMALRLARFNTEIEIQKRPKWHGNYFVGMPAPAGAFTVLLPFYLSSLELLTFQNFAFLTLVYVLIVASLLVSKVPTYSHKIIGQRRIPRDVVLPLLFSILIYTALLLSYPWIILALSVCTYFSSIPFSFLYFQKQKLRHKELRRTENEFR
ncbi:MAG: phosphatidylcholine/phosphatidylserine synthase [Alphaproteobacteria bacterium]|nr:phosphatidylcholine/phosphatidylserine synthase [Alphaproteobacteria bacterium]